MEMVLQQSQMRWSSSSNTGAAARPVTPPTMTTQEQETPAGGELRRGPWTVDEDLTLINYIAEHGEGRWNALARAAGLKRTGKSCRLRWLNYLRPDVKRGDFTADEQLLILDLHSRWGNRWSKIATQLPGRTDNEIKNYWRTRVQKQAKRLNCDASSARFKDAITAFLWTPRLADRQHATTATATGFGSPSCGGVSAAPSPTITATSSSLENNYYSSPGSAVTTSSSASTSSDQSAAHEEKAPGAARVHGYGAGGGETWSCGDWWAVQGADHEFWSSMAPAALQQLNVVVDDQFQDQDLSGWVQGLSEDISENNLWSLEDIWRMQ